MKLNCSSYRSYPPVKLHWYVNEEPVSRFLTVSRQVDGQFLTVSRRVYGQFLTGRFLTGWFLTISRRVEGSNAMAAASVGQSVYTGRSVSWTSVESWTNPEPFSMTTTFSRMTHTVSPEDFNDGVMRVRCTASMNGTDYWESQEISASRIGNVLPKSERSQISNASARTRPRLSLLQTLQIMFAVLAMLLA
ncbi:hypothetical protein FJT64_021784 [Amphibalanus amphitrite]|uniref:Ig-like domain-containing protein n=1 Tax=Amphibalanus amphitrite TaxID=1232801 RepID=A0A6A4WWI6_AMPAM|nr:hypothetical protein FJT64_021784 [Amphibalanus amphitrite]